MCRAMVTSSVWKFSPAGPAVIFALSFCLFANLGLAMDISACNAVVPAGTTGVLQADLVCSPQFGAVLLLAGATLDMNGHSITGDFTSVAAVRCSRGKCTVSGPGDISGGPSGTAVELNRSRLTIDDISIHDCGNGILQVTDEPSKVNATNVMLTRLGQAAVSVNRIVATSVSATANGGAGLTGNSIGGTSIVASNNGAGLFAGHVKVTGLTADSNQEAGVRADHIKLTNSEVIGNNGAGIGADLLTDHIPHLVNTTCGKSFGYGDATGTDFHVCTGD
jgi:hypothetical protein